ncbi:MAG: amidohydrolase [Bacillota bacterium]
MERIKQIVDRYLLENSEKWIRLGKDLLAIPELGFHEYKTSALVKQWFESIGADEIVSEAVTAQRIRLRGGKSLAHVAMLGEMDAIYCPSHPHANRENGLAHACGHNIQVTALLAVAEALKATGVMSELSGDVSFMAVPSEEALPADVIASLIEEGKTSADSGKKELLRLGAFDGVDIALGTHAYVNDDRHGEEILVNTSCNGLIVESFVFHGRSSHSTVAPERGINALNAAVLAINNIQALRESLDPAEYVRIAYNLTEGGESVGTIPERAKLEVVLATKTMEYLLDLKERIRVAAECGAKVIGCAVAAKTEVSLLPYEVDEALLKAVRDASLDFYRQAAGPREHNYFSNDLGDVSQKIPTAQVVFGGFTGAFHTRSFTSTDDAKAFVQPARCMAALIIDLLCDDAKKALSIKEHFKSKRAPKERL